LSGGPFLEAKVGVISTIDPQQTFLKLVGEEHLDGDFVESTNGWLWEHWGLVGVHLCLLEPPQFISAKNNPDVAKALIHVIGYESAEDFIRHQEMIAAGDFDDRAGFNCCFPTIHDPSQAPSNKHTGIIISCMAPFNLNGGNEQWVRYKFKEETAWKLINKLARYAPNITENVVRDLYVSTPKDIANKFLDMGGGSIKQGQYHPLQMGYLRPNEYCSTHRSPIKNLYMGGETLAVETDVSKEEDTMAMAQKTVEKFGKIDILINNASIYYGLESKPLEYLTVDEWDRSYDVNVKGSWLSIKAVPPHMKNAGKGCIINISSGTWLVGIPMLLHYATSKAAILGMVRCVSREFGGFGIRINAITPGFVMTEASKSIKGTPPETFDVIKAQTALGRNESEDDVVGTAVFLASEDAAFITGQNIAVDGGWHLY
jgi:NAD(P)-dependent dehydrogenase (short-subunit alcohol dehydrogenase family)